MTKTCGHCKIEKDITEFYLLKKTGKPQSWCKVCRRLATREYVKNNPEKKALADKLYAQNNPEKCNATKKRWADANPEKVKESQANYAKNNPEKIKESKRSWERRNPDYRRNYFQRNKKKASTRYNNRYHNDLQFRLGDSLRKRTRLALRYHKKPCSVIKILGCTLGEFQKYIEAKFQPGMTWENWSITGWHLDHIRPLASFDLENLEEFKQACHYTNLQPLWAKDNLSKGAKWEETANEER